MAMITQPSLSPGAQQLASRLLDLEQRGYAQELKRACCLVELITRLVINVVPGILDVEFAISDARQTVIAIWVFEAATLTIRLLVSDGSFRWWLTGPWTGASSGPPELALGSGTIEGSDRRAFEEMKISVDNL